MENEGMIIIVWNTFFDEGPHYCHLSSIFLNHILAITADNFADEDD